MVTRPVGLVDLAPTFCAIAGLAPQPWMQGTASLVDDADADARGFERGADRVGQRVVRRLRPPAHDHARPLGVHRLRAGLRPRRNRGRVVRPHRRPAPARQPLGRSGAAIIARIHLVADLWDHRRGAGAITCCSKAPVSTLSITGGRATRALATGPAGGRERTAARPAPRVPVGGGRLDGPLPARGGGHIAPRASGDDGGGCATRARCSSATARAMARSLSRNASTPITLEPMATSL